MPVEFLTDAQAAAYDGAPSRAELERFFLDDADRALIEPKRRTHNRSSNGIVLSG
ncbi:MULTISPECIES: DUF4158 domain-containing protein [Streptomyces]|uniref:DUF4158 domain-containing protein n=1 Tax=Streptomyces TaxID=1883 RepID=UPI0018836D6E|nr:DUF4158 domain-containing protein [Streptomyces acidicola]